MAVAAMERGQPDRFLGRQQPIQAHFDSLANRAMQRLKSPMAEVHETCRPSIINTATAKVPTLNCYRESWQQHTGHLLAMCL
jgi:hypothetical protein